MVIGNILPAGLSDRSLASIQECAAEMSSAAQMFVTQNFSCFPQSVEANAGIMYPDYNVMTPAGKPVFVFSLNGQVHVSGSGDN